MALSCQRCWRLSINIEKEEAMKFSFPESWQNGEVDRLPAISVRFSVQGMILTWRINDNQVISSSDDDEARVARTLSELSAEGRIFSSWQEAARYMQLHYAKYAARFIQAVEPLLSHEKEGRKA